MNLDGRRQRNALTAAERAIDALAAGDREAASLAASRAVDLDQIGVFGNLSAAVGAAPDPVDDAGWETIRASLPPGPLHALIDSVAGADG